MSFLRNSLRLLGVAGATSVTLGAGVGPDASFGGTPDPRVSVISLRVEGEEGGLLRSDSVACVRCVRRVTRGALITIKAVPTENYRFDSWVGDGSCARFTIPVCVVSADTSLVVGARFERASFSVSVTVAGSGTVSSDPEGITCGARGDQCQSSFAIGTNVTLTSVAEPGFHLNRWGVGCTGFGSDGICVLTSTDESRGACAPLFCVPLIDRAASAVFASPSTRISISQNPKLQGLFSGETANFEIMVANTGNVRLTNVRVSDALAPDCARTMAQDARLASMAPGASVIYGCSLETAAPGAYVATVAGTPPTGTEVKATDTATVVVFSPQVGATKHSFRLTIGSTKKNDRVEVVSTASGTRYVCRDSCERGYAGGTRLTLTAKPPKFFRKWLAGPCTGQGSKCTLVFGGERLAVTAIFRSR
jgi:hypothetical protein